MITNESIISTAAIAADGSEEDETTGDAELRVVTVAAQHHGLRLDKVLSELVPEFSRSYLQQLIDLHQVKVAGRPALKPASKVKAGDEIEIVLTPTPQSQAFTPQEIALDIIYQDDHIIVINKQPGLVVHPAPGNWSGTLLNGLLFHDPAIAQVPRAGIVHRLDKDTSGLMVVARSRAVMDKLIIDIAGRVVGRQYLAMCQKPWIGPAKVQVNAAIGRDPRNRLRMAVVDLERTSGKPARTDFALIDSGANGSLVRCILHTGRTHQIRVHMASMGYPLCADTVYGGAVVSDMARQALHAFKLEFDHPVTKQAMRFTALPPADFCSLLSAWGLSYNGAD